MLTPRFGSLQHRSSLRLAVITCIGSRRGNKWISKPSFRVDALKKIFNQDLKIQDLKPPMVENKATAQSEDISSTASSEGKRELFDCDNSLTIRGMLAMGSFNAVFWTHYLATSVLFNESKVQVQGKLISLASGEPFWGFLGIGGTALILYATHQFATHSVRRAYLTADKQRIGFQMNNILGNAGRTLEVKLGLAKVIDNTGPLASSYIPVKIVGASLNIILDDKGNFHHDKELLVILDKYKDGYIQPREERIGKFQRSQSNKQNPRSNTSTTNNDNERQ